MKIFGYLKHHKVIMGALLAVVIIITAIASRVISRNQNQQNTDNSLPRVSLVLAGDFRKDQAEVQANGTVESLQQAELRSQVNAAVAKINVSVGSAVKAGQVLISVQNADIAAQLAQAQANVKAQQALLDQMKKGTRSEELKISQTQLDTAQQNLEDTKKQQDISVANARSALLNSGLDAAPGAGNTNTVTAFVSGAYTGTEQGQYQISIYVSGSGSIFQYSGLEQGTGMVDVTPQPLGKKGLFIQFSDRNVPSNNIWTILIPNTKSPGYVTYSSAYQAAVQGRQAAIDAATNALATAQSAYDLKAAGATNEQLKAQEAALEQALASVQSAAAQLDKTYIRSPIDGTVSAVPVKYGELLTMGESVASIVNKNGLQVKAYVSGDDLPLVAEGATVTIGQQATGTVSSISPSLDPKSKNAEVNVLVLDPSVSGLTVGQTVEIKIVAKRTGDGSALYLLPLQAVKIDAGAAYVFTVDGDSVLQEHPVVLGDVSGENVEVKTGLDADMKIVSPVYELIPGRKVTVE